MFCTAYSENFIFMLLCPRVDGKTEMFLCDPGLIIVMHISLSGTHESGLSCSKSNLKSYPPFDLSWLVLSRERQLEDTGRINVPLWIEPKTLQAKNFSPSCPSDKWKKKKISFWDDHHTGILYPLTSQHRWGYQHSYNWNKCVSIRSTG